MYIRVFGVNVWVGRYELQVQAGGEKKKKIQFRVYWGKAMDEVKKFRVIAKNVKNNFEKKKIQDR